MAFQFTLQTVLRFRQSQEDRELLHLQALLGRKAALRHELDQLQQLGLDLLERTGQALLEQATPAVEIHFAMARLRAFDSRQENIRQQLPELESAIAQQRSLFQRLRRNREALETLREAQLREYRLVQQRREQGRLDEMHLLRSKPAVSI